MIDELRRYVATVLWAWALRVHVVETLTLGTDLAVRSGTALNLKQAQRVADFARLEGAPYEVTQIVRDLDELGRWGT
jgi:hypothetical protein